MKSNDQIITKINFIYASITDTQGTIRALDTKTNYLLIILSIPFLKLGSIFSKCHSICELNFRYHEWITKPIIILFVVFWILSILASYRVLCAVDNPQKHISGELPESSFYNGHLFTMSLYDVIRNRDIKSLKSFQQHLKNIPEDETSVLEMLTLEQMKLAYIRSIKIVRSQWAYKLSAIWATIGGIIWMTFLLNK